MAWVTGQRLDKECLEGSGVCFFSQTFSFALLLYVSVLDCILAKHLMTFKFSRGTIIQKRGNTWKRE